MPSFIKVDKDWKNIEYEKKLIEYFRQRVPEKVFDAHSHISKWEIDGVPENEIFEYAYSATDRILGGGKLKGGLTMGNPYDYETQEEYEDDRKFSCENGNKHEGFVTGLLVRPEDGPEDVERWLRKYPRIVALKPYWVFARADHMESDISGVGEALTMIYAFKDFDRKKLMYGSDGYNFGHNLYGRCFGISDEFSALYTGTPIPGLIEPPYRFKGLETMTEGLIATFAAGDIAGLTATEYEDLFYNNAANLYYSRIRK